MKASKARAERPLRASEVYLRAAAYLDDPETGCAGICYAISRIVFEGYGSKWHRSMEDIFQWNSRNYFGVYGEHNRQHRVLSLLLMSALAADEEKERK